MSLIADKKKNICPPMICAQRLLRKARATDEEEMMEIHLEKSNGKKQTKKSASNTGNSMDYNSGEL